MANVKISNLPVETVLANMTGIAGYNASGTAQISGATIDSAFAKSNSDLQFIVDNGNVIDSNTGTGNILFKNSSNFTSTTMGVNSISSDTSFSIIGTTNNTNLTFTSGGELRFTPNASLGTPNTGYVLTAKNAQGDVEWSQFPGFAPALPTVLTNGYTGNSGQQINLTTGGTVTQYSQPSIVSAGTFSITQGNNSLLTLGNGGSPTTILGGSGAIQVGDTGSNLLISTNGSDKLQLSVNSTGEVQFYLGSNNPGPAIGDVLTAKTTSGDVHWTTPSSGGGGGGYTALTPAASTVWDGSNGLSASWQPTVTTPFNTLDMSSGFSAGDRGSLIIDVSTTTNFILPSNSKAADGDISVSGVNKTILDYVYDGTNFYWSNRKNMIDPIYLPTVSTTNLVSFYIPSQYQGSPGNVSVGSAWINSYTSNNLVGDLSRVGTDLDDIQFVAKDDVNEIPAHFLCGSDGSTSSYWNVSSALGGNVLGGSWTGALWFKTISSTSSGFHGIMDPDKDDDESIYVYNRRLYIEGPNLYTNFPSFEPATTGGNDNAFSLEDEWIYVSVSFDHPNNTMSVILACQATLDNASGTIIGYNGSNINISADGTYQETLSATLTDNTWDDFAYGASVSSSGTAFSFEGGIGLAAVYGTNVTDTLAISNWNATKEYYYIS